MEHFAKRTDKKIRRTVHSKVRTGCKTCKKRRVKCDEAKPKCKRCINFGVDCDGYSSSIIPQSSAAKCLIPKLELIPQRSSIFIAPARSLFNNQQEYRYFQSFCSQTSHHLSGYFSPKFWRSLVLQTCESDVAIRHAVVALGALDFQTFQCQKRKLTRQQQFALRQYSKSVLQIRQRVAGGKVGAVGSWGHQNLRLTLIACLLFACFEAFHGSLDAAIAQIHAGVRMIEEWLIALQTCVDRDQMTSLSSPRPTIIEDEIVQIFARLDLESLSSGKNSGAKWKFHQRFFGQRSIDTMPIEFADLTEARAYMELVERRSIHWMPWIEVKEGSNLILSFHHVEEIEPYDEILQERNNFLTEGMRWAQAFKPLWVLSQQKGGETLLMGATILKLQGLVAHTCKSSVACSREFIYVESTRYLREIVDLARVVIEFSKARSSYIFSFDVHVIYSLAVVGLRFRHRKLRREAIAMLLERRWREGVWDSLVVGKTMQWIADIEDERLTVEGVSLVEHVSEDQVARDVRMQHDVAGRKTTVSCLQPVKGLEVLLPRVLVIPWL